MLSYLAKGASRSTACRTTTYISAARRTCACLGPYGTKGSGGRDVCTVSKVKHAESPISCGWKKSIDGRRYNEFGNLLIKQTARCMSSTNEEAISENIICGNGLKNDGTINGDEGDNKKSAATDTALEKSRGEEEDFWLKMCSNQDPNDNTILPDAYFSKGRLEAQDGFNSPPDNFSPEHD